MKVLKNWRNVIFKFDSTDHPGRPVLNSLEALQLMCCDAAQQRITVIQVGQDKCCHYALKYITWKKTPDAADAPEVKCTLFT